MSERAVREHRRGMLGAAAVQAGCSRREAAQTLAMPGGEVGVKPQIRGR